MGLIELCLLSLVTPQEPAAPTAPAVAVQAPAEAAAQGPRALLVQLEAAGDYADADALAALTSCEDAEVAARAAWLLAMSRNQTHVAVLPDVWEASSHAEVRLHAMNGLLQRGDSPSTATAIEGLEDEDPRVRTVAAQLLGLAGIVLVDHLLDRHGAGHGRPLAHQGRGRAQCKAGHVPQWLQRGRANPPLGRLRAVST